MATIHNELYFNRRDFQAHCMTLGSGCYHTDVDLFGYVYRAKRYGVDQPQSVFLLEAKCVDRDTTNAEDRVERKKITMPESLTKCIQPGYFHDDTAQLRALAVNAAIPLFLVAYRHNRAYLDWLIENQYEPQPEAEPPRDLEWFGVACAWPVFEEQFTWLTADAFKQWQLDIRGRLRSFLNAPNQVNHRKRIYEYRAQHLYPRLHEVLGLTFEPRTPLPAAEFDRLPPEKQAKHLRDDDLPMKTRLGVEQRRRGHGRNTSA